MAIGRMIGSAAKWYGRTASRGAGIHYRHPFTKRNIPHQRGSGQSDQHSEDELGELISSAQRIDQSIQQNNQLLAQIIDLQQQSKTAGSTAGAGAGIGAGIGSIASGVGSTLGGAAAGAGARAALTTLGGILKRVFPGAAFVGAILGAAELSNKVLDSHGIANKKGATIEERKARAKRRQRQYDTGLDPLSEAAGAGDLDALMEQQKKDQDQKKREEADKKYKDLTSGSIGWKRKQEEEQRNRSLGPQSYNELEGSLHSNKLASGIAPVSFGGFQSSGFQSSGSNQSGSKKSVKITAREMIFKADTINFDIGQKGSGGFESRGSGSGFQNVSLGGGGGGGSGGFGGTGGRSGSSKSTSLSGVNLGTMLPGSLSGSSPGAMGSLGSIGSNIEPGVSGAAGASRPGRTGGGGGGGSGSGSGSSTTTEAPRFSPPTDRFSTTQTGPNVDIQKFTPMPSTAKGGDGSSRSQALAEERAQLMDHLDKNPALKEKFFAIASNEQGKNPQGIQAVMEETLNRAIVRGGGVEGGLKRLEREIRFTSEEGGYYADSKGSRARAEAYVKDPKNLKPFEDAYEKVRGGSNVSKDAYGNASGTLAESRIAGSGPGGIKAIPTESINGETFFKPNSDEPLYQKRYDERLERLDKRSQEIAAAREKDGGKTAGGIADAKVVANKDPNLGGMFSPDATKLTGPTVAATGAIEGERQGNKQGTVTVAGSDKTFAWGSGAPGVYGLSAGSYNLNVPPAQLGTGPSWGDVGPIGQNYPASMGGPALATVNEPGGSSGKVQSHGGIQIHGSSSSDIDRLYTQGCFAVSKKDFPEFKEALLAAAKKHGSLTLEIGKDNVARIGGARVDAPVTLARITQNQNPVTGAMLSPNAITDGNASQPQLASAGNATIPSQSPLVPTTTSAAKPADIKPAAKGNLGFEPGADKYSPIGFNKRGEPIFADDAKPAIKPDVKPDATKIVSPDEANPLDDAEWPHGPRNAPTDLAKPGDDASPEVKASYERLKALQNKPVDAAAEPVPPVPDSGAQNASVPASNQSNGAGAGSSSKSSEAPMPSPETPKSSPTTKSDTKLETTE